MSEKTRDRPPVAEALRQTVEEWQTTFDAISDLVIVVDAQDRIGRVNRAMLLPIGSQEEPSFVAKLDAKE